MEKAFLFRLTLLSGVMFCSGIGHDADEALMDAEAYLALTNDYPKDEVVSIEQVNIQEDEA